MKGPFKDIVPTVMTLMRLFARGCVSLAALAAFAWTQDFSATADELVNPTRAVRIPASTGWLMRSTYRTLVNIVLYMEPIN